MDKSRTREVPDADTPGEAGNAKPAQWRAVGVFGGLVFRAVERCLIQPMRIRGPVLGSRHPAGMRKLSLRKMAPMSLTAWH